MNLVNKFLKAFRCNPESYHLESIITELDDDGNYIGEEQYLPWVLQTLDDIVVYNQEYKELSNKLFKQQATDIKLDKDELWRVKVLDEIVGGGNYTRLSCMESFLYDEDLHQ